MNDPNVLDGDNFESQQPKKGDSTRCKKKVVKELLKYEETQTPKILTTSECLSGLSQIPGLLAMKLVAPAQANAMSRVYSMLLQHEKDQATHGNQAGHPREAVTASVLAAEQEVAS